MQASKNMCGEIYFEFASSSGRPWLEIDTRLVFG